MPKRPNKAHLRAVRAILDEPIRPVSDGPKPREHYQGRTKSAPAWLRQGGVPGREIILSGANANAHVVMRKAKLPHEVGCTVKALDYMTFGKNTDGRTSFAKRG